MPPTSPGLSESTEQLNFGRAETHFGGGSGGAAAGARSEEATLRLGAARSPKSSAAGEAWAGPSGRLRETGLSLLPAALMAVVSVVYSLGTDLGTETDTRQNGSPSGP